jgi:ectoine hydroxylase-related dioxygenase (phytanoyl-CoA dioxygenase family)
MRGVDTVKQLRESNDYLADTQQLREGLEGEGYLFFRNVIDADLIAQVKHGFMAWLEGQRLIKIVDDEPMHSGADFLEVGEYPPGLYDTRLWEWLAFNAQLKRLYSQVFGEPGYVLPIGEYQFTWPGKPDCWIRKHQDGPFFNHQEGPFGTGLDFVVCWVPLMDLPESLGGLAIVPSPRTLGSLLPDLEKDSASRFIAPDAFPDDAWCRADYRPGDVLIFGPFTPHCGMPNSADRLRLSIDFRVQPASADRLMTGVVIDARPDAFVIAADSGQEARIVVDERTALRLPGYVFGHIDISQFVGRRVIATTRDGRALVVRNTWGYVPWDQ